MTFRQVTCQARNPLSSRRRRRGAISVLAALFIVVMVALVAFAIDIGYIVMARTELQRAADASALAASWELIDENALAGNTTKIQAIENCRSMAASYAALNPVCGTPPQLDVNLGNDVAGEVVVGYLSDLSNPNATMSFGNPANYNAVQVRIRRTAQRNGVVPLFFGRLFGMVGAEVEGTATAAILNSVRGVRVPEDGSNVLLLPIVLAESTWEDLLNGNAPDDWTWNPDSETVYSGSDGICEVIIFPTATGSAGNSGTLRIGTNNNGNPNIARQIREGISASDLNFHGGELSLDRFGELSMTGNPGLSATLRTDLEAILGQPRMMPLYRGVSGGGSTADFTIVKFVGVRLLNVNLTGGNKSVVVQPANVLTKGAVAGDLSDSQYIYGPGRLVK